MFTNSSRHPDIRRKVKELVDLDYFQGRACRSDRRHVAVVVPVKKLKAEEALTTIASATTAARKITTSQEVTGLLKVEFIDVKDVGIFEVPDGNLYGTKLFELLMYCEIKLY
jgi:hypothetical protein